jgi:acyl-CoA synthetase (AMP-forming)/AMP-acid ligase II
MLLGEIIAGNARRRPGAIGWRIAGKAWSWREIEERVTRSANALLALGLRPGDRVGLVADNSHQLAELYFALATVGMIAVPINPRSVRRELEFVLRDVGARALLASGRLVERLSLAETGSELVEFLLGIEEGSGLPQAMEGLLAKASAEAPAIEVGPDSVRVIKYTSGTTGTPKGCISTQRQFLVSFLNYLIQRPFDPMDRCLLALPMTAGVGIQLLSTYCYIGAETLILERFDAARVLDAVEEQHITRFYVMPTMLTALAEEQEKRPRNLSSLRAVGYGGQTAPVALVLRAMDALGCPFYQTFGASESGGFVSYLMPEDHEELRLGRLSHLDEYGRSIVSCGREVQGFHIRIVDAARHELPPGEVGELAVKCDSVMSGYWNRPEATAEVIADGWLYSGDLARRDANGLIYIVDRKRDMIVSGGYNVYSAEVEAVIHEHSAVAEAAVVGIPDPYWGESVEAYVVLRPGAQASEQDLLDFAAERMASYKRPKRFVFLDELPRTNSGKMRKVELRKRHEGHK